MNILFWLVIQLSNFNGGLACNPCGYSSGVYPSANKIKEKIRHTAEKERFNSTTYFFLMLNYVARKNNTVFLTRHYFTYVVLCMSYSNVSSKLRRSLTTQF